MRIFCDTSVLVCSCLKLHPAFERARNVLRRVREGQDNGFISIHSLAETYAVLTAINVKPRITPRAAYMLISEDILRYFSVITLVPADYVRMLEKLASSEIIGGITYDGLIWEAARIANPERFYTFNTADFQRLAPDWSHLICEP